LAAFAPATEECYALSAGARLTWSSWETRDMDSYLDMLFDGLKGLEGRFIPKGWSATVVAGSAIGFGVVLTVLVFLLTSE